MMFINVQEHMFHSVMMTGFSVHYSVMAALVSVGVLTTVDTN